jgi:adenosylhomocysteine nucleosidase
VSWGFAGGLDPQLAAGTLLLPEYVTMIDGRVFATARQWRERLQHSLGITRIAQGTLLTSTEPLRDRQQKDLTFRQTGALAIDMESAAVAKVASSQGLPFLAVRVVLDEAHDTLPNAITECINAAGKVHWLPFITALAREPRELSAIARLTARYLTACSALSYAAIHGRSCLCEPYSSRVAAA